jgi:hypothetical protein
MITFPDWLTVVMMFLFCSHGVKQGLKASNRILPASRMCPIDLAGWQQKLPSPDRQVLTAKSCKVHFYISFGTKCRFPRDVIGWKKLRGEPSWSVKTI